MCHAIGRHGADLFIERGFQNILTHCNTGGLATSEYGTALGVIFTMQDRGVPLRVFVDETRPLLQGSRLTAWELVQRQVPATLLCDSMVFVQIIFVNLLCVEVRQPGPPPPQFHAQDQRTLGYLSI